MTYITDIHPPKSTVIGEYSLWPRKAAPRRRIALLAASGATAGVFLHCVLPFLAGA